MIYEEVDRKRFHDSFAHAGKAFSGTALDAMFHYYNDREWADNVELDVRLMSSECTEYTRSELWRRFCGTFGEGTLGSLQEDSEREPGDAEFERLLKNVGDSFRYHVLATSSSDIFVVVEE